MRGNFKTTPLVFPVTAGTTYRFAWDSYVATPESYRVNQSAYATIANDDFANRIPLSGTNIVVSGTTRIATREPGEPGDGDASVWYSWLAPGRGVLRPTVNGPAGSTVTVFTGTAVTNISAIPFVYGLDGELEVSVQAGQQYAIRVAAPDPAGSGPFELNLPFIAAPPNDNFSNATVLIGPSAVGSGNTWLATAEPNEPLHAGTDYRRSLWWTWTAPASTKVAVYASGVRFPPVFVVYTGNTLSSLSTVGGSNFTYYPRVFNATAGTKYRIVVASPDFGPGEVSLEIVGIPSNDTFANRAHLAGSFGSITGNNATASRESGEPTLNTTAI